MIIHCIHSYPHLITILLSYQSPLPHSCCWWPLALNFQPMGPNHPNPLAATDGQISPFHRDSRETELHWHLQGCRANRPEHWAAVVGPEGFSRSVEWKLEYEAEMPRNPYYHSRVGTYYFVWEDYGNTGPAWKGVAVIGCIFLNAKLKCLSPRRRSSLYIHKLGLFSTFQDTPIFSQDEWLFSSEDFDQ